MGHQLVPVDQAVDAGGQVGGDDAADDAVAKEELSRRVCQGFGIGAHMIQGLIEDEEETDGEEGEQSENF